MLWGLLLGNWMDLDHIYLRLIEKAPWFGSACESFGQNCSIGVYPLHTWALAYSGLVIGALVFSCDKKLKFLGWVGVGMFIHACLDYIHMITGFAI